MEPILKAYINEAIEVEKAGLKVNFKKNTELIFPEEFQKKLDEIPALKTSFNALTPGRNKKLFDGYLRAPDYRRVSNKYRTLTTGVYDWRKELEAIYITESAGGTESYVDRSIDFILTDLCRIANSAGVVKKQIYKYDPAKLPYHPSFFETELISPTFTNTIWDAFTELTKQMDILEISRTGQWAIKVDSLQDDNSLVIG